MALINSLGRRGALGLAGAAAIAGKARADNPSEVKIAMEVPLSGPWARSGVLEQMGARMAIDDANASGGIKALGGAKMKLIEYDAGDSAEKAKDAAQRMVAQEPDLAGGFGAWLSTFTLAITEVTERAELPWLTLSYSDLITGRGFKNVFQSSPTADVQAEETVPIVMELATKASGKRPTKVAIVGDNTASTVSFLKPIRDHVLKNLNLELVVDEIYTPPLADATTIVQKLRSGKPDFVLLQSTNVGDDKLLVEKFAEFAVKHHPQDQSFVVAVAAVLQHHALLARCFRSLDYLPAFIERNYARHFNAHVLAVFHRGDRHLRMPAPGSGNQNQIDVVSAQHGLEGIWTVCEKLRFSLTGSNH